LKEFYAYTTGNSSPLEQRNNLMDEISCRTYKNFMLVKHHKICRPKIPTHLPAQEKRYIVQLNSAPNYKNVSKTQLQD